MRSVAMLLFTFCYSSALFLACSFNGNLYAEATSWSAKSHFYWVHTINTRQREFIEVSHDAGVWQIRWFSQYAGEWPTILQIKNFNNFASLQKWQHHYFIADKMLTSLERWDIPRSSVTKWRKRHHELWKVDKQWNGNWEKKFATWVSSTINEAFFYKHGIKTDCADVVIAARWIFARINHLPVANTISGSKRLFSHESVLRSWRHLSRSENWKNDQLFRAALEYVLNATSSWSLQQDSYPVRLDNQGLTPGKYIILYSRENDSWHTKLIATADYGDNSNLPLFTLASTAPRGLRYLVREGMIDEGWPIRQVKEIMAFRWPIKRKKRWILLDKNQHPDFSPYQFQGDGLNTDLVFYKALFARIKPNFSVDGLVDAAILDVKNYVQQRIDIVQEGSLFCKTSNCSSGVNWEAWSTPSRDYKLEQKIIKYENLFHDNLEDKPQIYSQWKQRLSSTFVLVNKIKLSLKDIQFIWQHKLYSSDPTKTLAERWGMDFAKRLQNYSARLHSLFLQRNRRIADVNCLNQDCRINTGAWWDGNTYLIDKKIMGVATLFHNYCSHFNNSEECLYEYKKLEVKMVKGGNYSLPLSEWFQRIALFNSDPRVDEAWRWGDYTNYYQYTLPHFNFLYIAKNGYALVDKKRVINLKTGHEIISKQRDEQIILSPNGLVFILDNDQLHVIKDNTKELLLTNQAFVSSELTLWKDKVVISSAGSVLVLDSVSLQVEANIIKKTSAMKISIADDYILFHGEKESEVIFRQQINHSFVIPSVSGTLSNLHLYANQVFGQLAFDGQMWIVTIDKKTKNIRKMISTEAKLQLWKEDKIIYSLDYESIKPHLWAGTITQDGMVTPIRELGTFLTFVEKQENGIVFAVTSAGKWDDDFQERQRLWSWDLLSLWSLSTEDRFQEGGEGYRHYFSGSLTLRDKILGKLPHMVTFYPATTSFRWEFQAGHGDLEGVGGISLDKPIVDAYGEIIPEFSFSKETLFTKLKNKHLVRLGSLIPTWEGNFIWVCKKYNREI